MAFNSMTDKITLELTLDELKTIDKHIELNEETKSVFDKIKGAYPQPKMTLENEGEYAVVSYNDTTYYRLMGETTYTWYKRRGVSANYHTPTLVMVTDGETERLLDGLYYNHIEVKKETEMIKKNLKTSLQEMVNGDVRPIDDVIEEAKERGEQVHNEMEEVVRESVRWCEEHPDTDPLDWVKPQNPEQTAQSLKEATENWKEIQKLIDEEDNDKNFKNSLDLIKEWGEKNKPITLYQLIEDWWSDIFCANSMDDMETCIDGLVDKIEEFLPKEHDTNSYKWNECIKMIKSKLR